MEELRYMKVSELEAGREVECEGHGGTFYGVLETDGARWWVASKDRVGSGLNNYESSQTYGYCVHTGGCGGTDYRLRYTETNPATPPAPKREPVTSVTSIEYSDGMAIVSDGTIEIGTDTYTPNSLRELLRNGRRALDRYERNFGKEA